MTASTPMQARAKKCEGTSGTPRVRALRPGDIDLSGVGTHFCMGSHIARLEMRVALEEFLRRFPNMSLAGSAERLQSNFISGIKRLPLNLR